MQQIKALCIILCIVALANADCPHQRSDLTRWSSWSDKPTGAMQNVTIPSGTKILLDESTPVMQLLEIYGDLVFDEKDLTLDAYFIYVRAGGHLWIGNEDCTYNSKSTITLHGTKDVNLNPNGFGSKVLGVWADGLLDMWGTVRGPTWTNLNGNVNFGATTITVAEDVQWQVGDSIVITSTDYDWGINVSQSEVRVISAVNGRSISFTDPLKYGHWGSFWQGNGDDKIDMRAEVGMLTRNIVIRGTVDTNDGWGGHVMIMESGHGRFYGVEVTSMGQKGLKARYPIHYHVAGDQSESKVSHCSFHDLFQRCLTIHGTSNLLVENNVAFNTLGHCFFIEDADETNNKLYFNLAISANVLDNLLTSDNKPAMFWITNPSNDFVGNVAVGGQFGFWFAMPLHPLGFAASDPKYQSWPRHSKLGLFIRNKAHSNADSGLFFDNGQINNQGDTELSMYTPRDVNMILANYFTDPSSVDLTTLQNTIQAVNPADAVVVEFTAYKCRNRGIWGRGDNIIIHNARLADNEVGVNCPGTNVIQGAVIVGESENVGNPRYDFEEGRSRYSPYFTGLPRGLFGIQSYDSGGGVIWNGISFYNINNYFFVKTNISRPSGAITGLDGPNVLTPSNKFFNMKFNNVQNPFYYQQSLDRPNQNALKGIALVDSDGSITGDCGSVVVGLGDHLRLPGCVPKPEWNAYHCPSNQTPLRNFYVDDGNDPQYTVTGTIDYVRSQITGRLTRLYDGASVTLDPRQKDIYDYGNGTTEITAVIQHTTNVRMYYDHLLMFGNDGLKTPSSLDLNLGNVQGGEWIRFAIPYPAGTTFNITAWYNNGQVKPGASKNDLSTWTYYFDSAAQLLWIHLQPPDNSFRWYHGLSYPNLYFVYNIDAVCPNNNCGVPGFNPGSVSSFTPQPDDSKRENWCEKSGPLPINGRMVWSNTGKEPYVVFDDNWRNSWNVSTNYAYNFATDQFYDGSVSLKMNNVAAYGGIYIGKSDSGRNSFDPLAAGYTHLEFKVRIGSMDAQRTFTVSLGGRLTNGTGIGFGSVDLSSPVYSNEQPTTDERWSVIRVALSEFTWPQDINLAGIGISQRGAVKLFETYIDGIQLASYTTSVEAIPGYAVNIQYDIPASPFDSGNGPGSSPVSPSNTPVVSAGALNGIGLLFTMLSLAAICLF